MVDQERLERKEKVFLEVSKDMEDAERQLTALIILEHEKNAKATSIVVNIREKIVRRIKMAMMALEEYKKEHVFVQLIKIKYIIFTRIWLK